MALDRGDSGNFEVISHAEFPTALNMPKYSFGQFHGEKTVILNLDDVSEKSRIPSLNVDGAVSLINGPYRYSYFRGFHSLDHAGGSESRAFRSINF